MIKRLLENWWVLLILVVTGCNMNSNTTASTIAQPVLPTLSLRSGDYAPGTTTMDVFPKIVNNSSVVVHINAESIITFMNTLWNGNPQKMPGMIVFEGAGSFSASDVGCSVVLFDSKEASRQLYACLMTYRLWTEADGYANAGGYANELAGTFMLAATGTIENPSILAEREDWMNIYMPLQNAAPTITTLPVEIK